MGTANDPATGTRRLPLPAYPLATVRRTVVGMMTTAEMIALLDWARYNLALADYEIEPGKVKRHIGDAYDTLGIIRADLAGKEET